jgi:hypothetical protein
VGTKVVVLVLLGATKLGCGLAPLLLAKLLGGRARCLRKFIGRASCSAGGFLLRPSGACCSMLPKKGAALHAVIQGLEA